MGLRLPQRARSAPAGSRSLPLARDAAPQGSAELVVDGQHFSRVVRDGILSARTSLDILTADFKSMLVPDPASSGRGRRSAPSIVQVMRRLAEAGVEIRLLHAGTPSSAALRELK